MNDESRPKAAPSDRARDEINPTLSVGSDSAVSLAYAADVYARAGWAVFPCQPGGKAPACAHGFKDATMDRAQIAKWWAINPNRNIGYPTGVLHDVLDVDVKAEGNGWDALYRLKSAGLLRGCVATARTRNGGLHLFYPASGAGSGKVAGWLDFKGGGGYVIVAPSRVAADAGIDGPGGYEWDGFGNESEGRPFDLETARCYLNPPRAQAPRHIRNIRKTPTVGVGGLVSFLTRQQQGNRSRALNWAAWKAHHDGQLDEATAAALIDAALALGLTLAEAEATIKSVRKAAA